MPITFIWCGDIILRKVKINKFIIINIFKNFFQIQFVKLVF